MRGFISIEELLNVYEIGMTKLDQDVIPVGGVFNRMHVIEHFEHIRNEIIKRAKRSMDDLARTSPAMASKIAAARADVERDLPKNAQQLEEDRNRDARAQRTQMGRAYAAAQQTVK